MSKVAVVTGAAQGLGRKIAERFLKADYFVWVLDINGILIEEMLSDIDPNGKNTSYYCLNIAKSDNWEEFIDYLSSTEHYQVDCLINNAGVMYREDRYVRDTPVSIWENTLNNNLSSYFLACKFLIPFLNHQASIINVSSSISDIGFEDHKIAYSVSKAAIKSLSVNLASELLPNQIRVNTVSPGYINTIPLNKHLSTEDARNKLINSIPLKRIASKEEVAEMIYFLSTEHARYITGQDIKVDGGISSICMK